MRRRVVALLALPAVALGAAGAFVARPLPPALLAPPAVPALRIEDRHGVLLRSTRTGDGALARRVPLGEMDPDLVAAFLAAEDRRFREHRGVDPRALARAAWASLRAGRVVSGGSTITMQLARLLVPIPRTVPGKLAQALWALRLEAHLPKDRILEEYLNRVPLGQGALGVDAAAALYFGADARRTSLGEAALLAGLAHAPSADNPLVAPARATARRARVLARLARLGYASAEEVRRAAEEPAAAEGAERPFLAPHFTARLLARAARAGSPPGGTWRTPLDAGLQEALEGEVRQTVKALADRGGRDAAVVVLDNPTGEILAWVGSPDFWADTTGQVDMVVSARQPGSALKPFVYGLAFDRGFTPASILPDVAQAYATSTGTYAPRNYDRRFHGPVRAREALGSSFNVPAVHLADRLGPAAVLGTLHAAGFASLARSPAYYGLGLALGNGDVTLLELANGYRALANGGRWTPVRWFAGDPPVGPGEGRRVVSPLSAALVLDILADPVARVPGFGFDTPLDFPFPLAAKTGTSRHFTDNWAAAVTGRFTVAAWVGDFRGRAMQGVSGVSGAGPLLRRAVLLTAARYAPGVLPTPAEAGAVPARICRTSGLLAGPRCPAATEWFAPDRVPGQPCDWHRDGGVALPAEYAEWAAERGAVPTAVPPASSEDDRFRIVSPRDGDTYRVPPGVEARYATVALRAGGHAPGPLRWEVDGRPVAGGRWTLVPGAHVVRVRSGTASAEARIAVE